MKTNWMYREKSNETAFKISTIKYDYNFLIYWNLDDISDTSGSKNKENFDNSDGEDLFKQIGLEDNPPANINKNDNISALKQHVNQIKDNAVKFIIKSIIISLFNLFRSQQ